MAYTYSKPKDKKASKKGAKKRARKLLQMKSGY